MMKSYILSALALGSALLSFFYEVQPSAATSVTEETSLLTPAEQLEEWTIAHNNFNVSEPTVAEISKEKSLTFKDSLFYQYYSQSYGLKLEFNEDKELLETVADWIGTPYRSGGSSQRGADCSGFVTRVYKEVYGVSLSRSSRSMFHDVNRVSRNEMETGDLVFFRRGPGQPIYHVGIYLKNGKFIHSASNGGVMINSLNSPYYKRNFYAAGRVI